jgi:hypothetical protein
MLATLRPRAYYPAHHAYSNLEFCGEGCDVKLALRTLALIVLFATFVAPQTRQPSRKPLDKIGMLALLAGEVPSQRVAMLIEERGIDFEPASDGGSSVLCV